MSSTRETKTNQREQGDASCRLDVWLFRTRLLKTRTLAARLISKGKVRLRRNGQMERIKKPHALIRPGDHVVFMRGQELISVEMLSAGIRRGPAPEAQRLYVRLEDANSSP